MGEATSKSIEALEQLLEQARSRVLDIQRGMEANIQNIVDCKNQQNNVLSDIEYLEHQLSILRKM